MLHPKCVFCRQNLGVEQDATLLAAQSSDRGQTVKWVAVCADHADGWTEGSDWDAPMYVLVEAAALRQLAERLTG